MSARYTGGLVYNAPGGWSGYFDGSGDYLTLAANTAFAFGTGDFTIEFWAYKTANTPGSYDIAFGTGDIGTGNSGYFVELSSTRGFVFASNNAVVLSYAMNPNTSSWTHYAVTRSGSTLRLFVNGAVATSTTYSSSLASTVAVRVGGTGNDFFGYLSNMRVVKGTAVYTATFTPPTGALQPISGTSLLTCAYSTFRDGSSNNFTITVNGNSSVNTLNPFPTSQLPNPALGNAGNGVYTMSQYATLKAANLWPAFDPYYRNVTLNLHGNGTNAAQNNTFLDSSTNNFTITRNGNTTQGTFSPYGANWSNYFDGSGDFLTCSSSATNFSTSSFTIEFWVNFASIPASGSNYNIISATVTNGVEVLYRGTGNYIEIGRYAVGPSLQYSWTPSIGTWNHVAFVRNGTTITIYINGTSVTSGTVSQDFQTGTTNIGSAGGSTSYFAGYLSNMRVVKSTAVYTSNFTPSTTPLTAITNTSLLTCADNRFIDDSTNNFTITRNGDVSVQRFSPFNATSAYSTSVIGGSGYFDGTGDYLTLSSNASLGFGTGAYTVECWIYVTAAPAFSVFFAVSTGGLQFGLNSAGNIAIAEQNVDWRLESSTPPVLNAWNHVAATRDGSSATKLFLNGVQIASNTNTTNYVQGTTGNINLNPGNANKFTGYMTDLRVVKGTAIYTGAFTPPSAPLTAITNTSLLTNFTNAAIFDNSMMTDWETLGGAQLNTTFKKYGSGSISMLATGDYCRSTQPSTVGDINGGDFTIEFWVYFTSVAAGRALISKYGNTAENAGGLGYVLQFQQSIPSLRFVLGVGGGTDAVYDFAWSPVVSTWYHVAVTRSGSSARAFINGSQIGSTTTVSISDVASPNGTQIGKTHTVAQYLLGYMDDVRVTKGVARYTANFTPPTSQVQDQ